MIIFPTITRRSQLVRLLPLLLCGEKTKRWRGEEERLLGLHKPIFELPLTQMVPPSKYKTGDGSTNQPQRSQEAGTVLSSKYSILVVNNSCVYFNQMRKFRLTVLLYFHTEHVSPKFRYRLLDLIFVGKSSFVFVAR